LSTVLIASGHTQSRSDFSLFIKQSVTRAFTTIIVYVDDMILTGNDNSSDRMTLVSATHHSNFCPINFLPG